MVRAPHKKNKSGKLPEEARSLRSAARQLGCHHTHLMRVLRGDRESRSLLARYTQLKEAA
jgi:hypothetical protein